MTARAVQPERRLLNYRLVAAYLGISASGAKQLAKDGEIVKVHLGSRVLFDKVDLDAFIERKKRAI